MLVIAGIACDRQGETAPGSGEHVPAGITTAQQNDDSNGETKNGGARQAPDNAAAAFAPIPDVDTSALQAPIVRKLNERRTSLKADPTSAKAWGEMGMVFDVHGFSAEAIACYEQAHRLAPNDNRWPYFLAIVLDEAGDQPERALTYYRLVEERSPGYPPTTFRLGQALLRVGKSQEAIAAFRRALSIDDTFALAHRALGQALLAADDAAAARPHLERSAELMPDDSTTFAALSQCYLRVGEQQKAQDAAAKAGTLQPRKDIPDRIRREVYEQGVSSRICNERAVERMAAGDFAGAIEDLKIVLEVHPDSAIAHLRLGACYLKMGNRPEAILALSKAVELQDDLVEAHVQLGTLAMRERRLEQAAHHFQRAADHGPADRNVLLQLGACYAQLGDCAKAVSAWSAAGDIAPLSAKDHMNWGTCLLRLSRPEEALGQYDLALKRKPDYPEAHYNTGLALEQLGRRDDAIESYQRAADLDPTSPAAGRLDALRSISGQ